MATNIPAASSTHGSARRITQNKPRQDLLRGPREYYIKIAVPLYEASLRGDWKAAKAIIDCRPEFVRYSITENGETALHIAASAKRSKKVVQFVQNLVDLMEKEDLMLENENFNTPLYLAATAGNVEAVKVMVEKNIDLVKISGNGGTMMPLYAAALFGKYKVVKYLYYHSNDLCDDGWTPQSRASLVEKCVDADVLGVALQIVKKYPNLGCGDVFGMLARKPEAFSKTKSNIIKRTINSVFSRMGTYKNESEALQLLKIILEEIANKPRHEIDKILRGSPDSIKHDNMPTSENVVQVLQLQNLISEHLKEMEVEKDAKPASREVDEALHLQKLISKHLVNMHLENQNIIKQDNKPISGKGDQALELHLKISNHIVSMHLETNRIMKHCVKENHTRELRNLISKSINDMRAATNLMERHSSRVLFVAAEMGNTDFLVELIRRYPDLLWKVNDNNQTIFHVAVKYRHEGIYNLLYEIGPMRDVITPLKDEDGNNMLHLAAKSTNKKRLEDVSGAALQMQRELLWFQEVRNIIPPSNRERKNKDGLTPRELFSMEHTDLITQGEKWMKETANQCMIVAALIATIVFAAAFTVPGGYNQNDGIPIYYQKLTFVVFVVADAISLFLSSASILTFLSILTSRYAERDFIRSLPLKLMLGLTTLFLSITTMMVTFSVSFFVLYYKQMKWIPVLIGVFATSPVLLYVVLQYHLLVDVICSTYGSKYLFKPDRQVLYYKNPRI